MARKDSRVPTQRDQDRYEDCPQNGLRRAIVRIGRQKRHLGLRNYVDITQAVRWKFGGNASYIDLYSGPVRARLRQTGEVVERSALAAASEAVRRTPFREIIIGDLDSTNVAAREARLNGEGATNVRAASPRTLWVP
jgi:hypothetical protein